MRGGSLALVRVTARLRVLASVACGQGRGSPRQRRIPAPLSVARMMVGSISFFSVIGGFDCEWFYGRRALKPRGAAR